MIINILMFINKKSFYLGQRSANGEETKEGK
jgi:hypothetical protein